MAYEEIEDKALESLISKGIDTPTQDELNDEMNRIYLDTERAENNKVNWSIMRKNKYDQLNQFELISNDSINGTTTHKDAILAIKAEFPKETN